MAIADTKSEIRAQGSTTQETSPPSQPVSQKIETPQFRKAVDRLLRLGLNPYQLKLNANLLTILNDEFGNWIAELQSEVDQQIRQIPANVRQQWLNDRLSFDKRRSENQPLRFLGDFLFQHIEKLLERLETMRLDNQEFRRNVGCVVTEVDRRQIIMHYAEKLGSTRRELKGDAKAFSRWFDEEAVTDRYLKQVGALELQVTFTLDRLGQIVKRVFQVSKQFAQLEAGATKDSRDQLKQRLVGIWKRLNIESRLQSTLVYDGDSRVHIAAMKFLRVVLAQLPSEWAREILDHRTLVFVNRAALESNSDVWIQCEALSILAGLSMTEASSVLNHRLTNPADGDDLFVRRHVWKIWAKHLTSSKEKCLEIHEAEESSPFVRQKKSLVAFLSTHPDSNLRWSELVLHDEVAQVRAAALCVVLECEPGAAKIVEYLKVLCQSLEAEKDPFVVRTALHAAIQLLKFVQNVHDNGSDSSFVAEIESTYLNKIVPLVSRLQFNHEETPVRRWAAKTNERIWSLLDGEARDLINKLKPLLFKVRPGRSRTFPKSWFCEIPEEKLGRIFAVLAQDDFGYDVEKSLFGYRVRRGSTFGFRFWRFYFEFTNTATDKRQALRHTTGRISTAKMRAPSQILGELSETKVPGEPLTIGAEGSWRPFLPLLDDFVSVLNMSWFGAKRVSFYSSEGVTCVTGPRTLAQRMKACYELSFRFAKYASYRNWNDDSFPASTYLESLRKLGFEIEFVPRQHSPSSDISISRERQSHPETIAVEERPNAVLSKDESVSKFFAASVVALPLGASAMATSLIGSFFESPIWNQIKRFAEYFSAPYENSLEQLVIFAGLVLLAVVGKHFYSNYSFRKARRRIPISIGGWGTRGKSGTERLKAALVGVMGHGLVSKTTGCEAMFIHSYHFGEPLEIPLFRPYDKATIWEHRNLIKLGADMDPSVFLWECMALNPNYVNVLQRQWTSDDLATITNTYPDHEDIQGPAGHNVATTIAGFVPLNSVLFTTEEVMRPFVKESCRLANSEFNGVGWLESGLITDDVLDRFPYREHPDNIALVTAMASKLGVEEEFSVKAQADYLVPDLGVLKTHPIASVRSRKIEFTNGMSANERFGCMGNWKRLGFDQQDPWEEPSTWVCGVVNNRADRVPRSKVFAKIIVEDLNADRFFLIGTNLGGLQNFIREAWQEKAEGMSLLDQGRPWDKTFALKTLKKTAWGFRQPIEEAHIQNKLKAMIAGVLPASSSSSQLSVEALAGSWKNKDELAGQLESAKVSGEMIAAILKHTEDLQLALDEYLVMQETIEDSDETIGDVVEQKYREMLGKWYQRKIVVIPNFDATGEDVIHRIVEEVPPGFQARVMGLQNIKGTGLDFVYRFQAWDVCNDACEAMTSGPPQAIERGLSVLTAMPAIGQLCREKVLKTINATRAKSVLQRADLQSQLDVLEKRVEGKADGESSEKEKLEDVGSSKDRSRLNQWLWESAEQFLDVGDSLRRRDLADVIYRDLANCRISRQRAVVELRKINKRQKGGWLKKERSKKSA